MYVYVYKGTYKTGTANFDKKSVGCTTPPPHGSAASVIESYNIIVHVIRTKGIGPNYVHTVGIYAYSQVVFAVMSSFITFFFHEISQRLLS